MYTYIRGVPSRFTQSDLSCVNRDFKIIFFLKDLQHRRTFMLQNGSICEKTFC